MMVKAAPRLATILCLSYVRLNAACPIRDAYRWFGNYNCLLASYTNLLHGVVSVYVHWQCQSGMQARPWCCTVSELLLCVGSGGLLLAGLFRRLGIVFPLVVTDTASFRLG